jgi:hypothetical protein
MPENLNYLISNLSSICETVYGKYGKLYLYLYVNKAPFWINEAKLGIA